MGAPGPDAALAPPGPCRLCGRPEPTARGTLVVLGRHQARYVQCPDCDLIQVDRPHWLAEAYEHTLSLLDTGVLLRNREMVRLTLALARLLGVGADEPCLDFGGGHGLFVRAMRDEGMDFRWRDPGAENLFARGFEARAGDRHRLVTALDVLEHLEDVRGGLDGLFEGRPPFVLVSTLLHTGWDPAWPYLAPTTGQHIAFYSARTLERVAGERGYRVLAEREVSLFVPERHGWHGHVERNARRLLNELRSPWVERFARVLARRDPFLSRTHSDHEWLRDLRKGV